MLRQLCHGQALTRSAVFLANSRQAAILGSLRFASKKAAAAAAADNNKDAIDPAASNEDGTASAKPKRTRRSRAAAASPAAALESDSIQDQAESADSGERSLAIRRDSFFQEVVKPEIHVRRPTRSTFKKPGFAKDLIRNLEDFPHALLLTRVGQFYESYFDQAIEISDLLKIRLTSKSMESKRYPMCGFPIAQMDKFMEKLVREHNKFVAICEEDKHFDKHGNLVKIVRKVVRVVTPGTLVDEAFIEKQSHNFLLAIDMPTIDSEEVELAWIDTSTGELFTQGSSFRNRSLDEDLARIAPAEIVLPALLEDNREHPIFRILDELDGSPRYSFPRSVPAIEEPIETPEAAREDGFSAIPLLSLYISQTLLEQQPDLAHPLRVRPTNTMRIDRVSLKALEIKQNNDGGRAGTLISVMDRTVTSAGMRLLSDRLTSPSKSIPEIQSRHALVDYFVKNPFLREEVIHLLHQLDDEARLLQKMSIGRPTAEDLLTMAKAIRVQIEIKKRLAEALDSADYPAPDESKEVLRSLVDELYPHDALASKIEVSVDIKALEAQRTKDQAAELADTAPSPESVDETEEEGIDIWNVPLDVVKGKRKKKGAAEAPSEKKKVAEAPDPPIITTKNGKVLELITWGKQETTVLHPDSSTILSKIYDNMRKVQTRAKRLHSDLVKQMSAIPTEILLRVLPRFGPIIRIGWKKTHSPSMREALTELDHKGTITLVRKAASARYFSHNHWTKLNSEMQGLLVQLKEAEAYAVKELCSSILTEWQSLRRNAAITAELDVATSLAKSAEHLDLIRPTLNEENMLDIADGRHPVAEFELKRKGREFISNSTRLDDESRLHIITGPNMGGKSTVLRQVGLITVMAQAGSFVPAQAANIGIIDQIFARIRYSDNIARGRSSFRVEMDDASYILEKATDKSLVLLDEFGRGTTADYAACIAEATIYALTLEIKARSLFATHLHDIYDILQEDKEERAELRKKIAFFCTSLAQDQADIKSLNYHYKLEPGINRNAEAFKVALLSGYPDHLLKRAEAVYAERNDMAN